MNTEQERAAFEAWAQNSFELHRHSAGEYSSNFTQTAWAAWQARAALQSQDHPNRQGRVMDKLFCDLKTDEEKAAFFLSGRGYETGVISQAIQNDVAMAYHRCVEYKKELEALQSQDREDALVQAIQEAIALLGPEAPSCSGCEYEWNHALRVLHEAIDHARRIEGEGK